MDAFSGIWAVVPVKDLEGAKQRLASALDQGRRTALYRAMLEGVLDALCASRRLAGVLVVTRDAWAGEQARARGARVLGEPRNDGHTAASTLGASHLAGHGAEGMLQIPGDLPLLAARDVDALLAEHGRAPAVTIAPSRDEQGSNAVACSPPDLLPLRFGAYSYFPHLARARALGVEPVVVRREGFALDVDTPQDLEALLAVPGKTRAHVYLEEIGFRRGEVGDGRSGDGRW